MYGWKTCPNAPIRNAFKVQSRDVMGEFEQRVANVSKFHCGDSIFSIFSCLLDDGSLSVLLKNVLGCQIMSFGQYLLNLGILTCFEGEGDHIFVSPSVPWHVSLISTKLTELNTNGKLQQTLRNFTDFCIPICCPDLYTAEGAGIEF